MKKFLYFFTFLLFCSVGFAQNHHLPYQAVVRDANGELISNRQVVLNYTIQHGGGTENGADTVMTNKQGLATVYMSVSNDIVWENATITVDVIYDNITIPGVPVPIYPVPSAIYSENTNISTLPLIMVVQNFSDTTLPTEGAVLRYGDDIQTAIAADIAVLETRIGATEQQLSCIEPCAEVNVQSDWNETNVNADAFIQSKPDVEGLETVVGHLRDSVENLYDSIAILRDSLQNLDIPDEFAPTIIYEGNNTYSGNNSFTGNNEFSGTTEFATVVANESITVPSVVDPAAPVMPSGADCSQAVNFCDLNALMEAFKLEITSVFETRMQLIRDSLRQMRDSIHAHSGSELPEITGINLTGFNGEYDGTAHGVTINGTQPGDLVIYIVDGTPSFTPPTVIEDGTTNVDVWVLRPGFREWTGNANIVISEPTIIAAATANTPLCIDGTLELSSAGSTTGDDITYAWSGPSGFSSTDANPTIDNVTTSAAGTYTLTVTKNAIYSETGMVEVVVNSATTSDTTATSCAEYTWHGKTYSTSGAYIDTLTNMNGCDSIITLHLTINALPTMEMCEDTIGGTVILKSFSNIESIQIYDGSVLMKDITTLDTNMYLVERSDSFANAFYSVLAINDDGCTATSTVRVNYVPSSCPGTAMSNENGSSNTITAVRDHEGNSYDVVQIGDQCWMRENMRAKTSPTTGTLIYENPAVSWSYTGKKAYVLNNDTANITKYGLLYNWNAAVDTFKTTYAETSTSNNWDDHVFCSFDSTRRGICPAGWHVPSDAEWTTLTINVGSNAGGKLAGGCDWDGEVYSIVGTPGDYYYTDRNATLFQALPSASRNYYFDSPGKNANFWSATQGVVYNLHYEFALSRNLNYSNTGLTSDLYNKSVGYSVRCLRD